MNDVYMFVLNYGKGSPARVCRHCGNNIVDETAIELAVRFNGNVFSYDNGIYYLHAECAIEFADTMGMLAGEARKQNERSKK